MGASRWGAPSIRARNAPASRPNAASAIPATVRAARTSCPPQPSITSAHSAANAAGTTGGALSRRNRVAPSEPGLGPAPIRQWNRHLGSGPRGTRARCSGGWAAIARRHSGSDWHAGTSRPSGSTPTW